MPCWTQEELSNIVKYFPNLNEETVMDRFTTYGGIPRYVLTKTDKWRPELNRAISKTKLEDLQNSLGGPEALDSVSHKVLQYKVVPQSGYRDITVHFASNVIAQEVTQKLVNIEAKKVVQFLQLTAGMPSIAAVRGVLFEQYAHKMLQNKGKWKFRSLATTNKLPEFVLNNNLELIVFDSLENLKVIDRVYYKPKSKKFTAVDSFVKIGEHIYFFQMTVSLTHATKSAFLDQHIEDLTRNSNVKNLQFHLVFVIPPEIFESFKT